MAGSTLVGVLGLRIITALADRSVFGEASLLVGMATFGRQIFVAPVSNVQIRYHWDFAERNQLSAFTRTVGRYMWRGTAISLCVGLALFAFWRWQAGGGLRLLLLAVMVAFLLADTTRLVPINWLASERLQGRVATWLVLEQVLVLGLGAAGLLLAQRFGSPTELYIAGQALGTFLVVALLGHLWFPRREGQDRPLDEGKQEVLAHIKSFGFPFVVLAVVSWLLNLGDRYALAGLLDADSVGSYVAAYAISSRAVNTAQSVLTGFARPILFQASTEGQGNRGQRVFLLWLAGTVAVGAAMCLLLLLTGDLIAGLLLDARYREGATELFVWIGLGHAMLGVAQVVENRLLSLGNSRALVAPSVLGAVANIGACMWFIPTHGALGAAGAKVVAYGANSALLVVMLLLVQRKAQPGNATTPE